MQQKRCYLGSSLAAEKERGALRGARRRAAVEEEAEICTSSACEVVAHAACPFQSDAAEGQEREEEAMDSRATPLIIYEYIFEASCFAPTGQRQSSAQG